MMYSYRESSKEDRLKAFEYVNNHLEEFDIWLIGHREHSGEILNQKDYMVKFYKETQRIENIDLLLGEDEEEENKK